MFPILFSFALSLLPTSTKEEIKILFLGDSITAGYGLPMHESYPMKLEALLQKRGMSVKSINGGVSGDTTAAGLRRLNWQLKSEPDLVVIALGANDMLRGIPPAETFQNLEKMIEALKAKKIKIALLGMKANPTLGKVYVQEFDSIYQRLAKKHQIAVMDFFISEVVMRNELNLQDRIHPNSKGQEVIAKGLADFIAPILAGMKKERR